MTITPAQFAVLRSSLDQYDAVQAFDPLDNDDGTINAYFVSPAANDTWANSATSGADIALVDGTATPALLTGQPTGQNSLQFTASETDQMTSAGSTAPTLASCITSTEFYWATVFRLDGAAGNQANIYQNEMVIGASNLLMGAAAKTVAAVHTINPHIFRQTGAPVSTAHTISLSTWYLLEMWLLSGTLYSRLNGADDQSVSLGGIAMHISAPSGNIVMGDATSADASDCSVAMTLIRDDHDATFADNMVTWSSSTFGT